MEGTGPGAKGPKTKWTVQEALKAAEQVWAADKDRKIPATKPTQVDEYLSMSSEANISFDATVADAAVVAVFKDSGLVDAAVQEARKVFRAFEDCGAAAVWRNRGGVDKAKAEAERQRAAMRAAVAAVDAAGSGNDDDSKEQLAKAKGDRTTARRALIAADEAVLVAMVAGQEDRSRSRVGRSRSRVADGAQEEAAGGEERARQPSVLDEVRALSTRVHHEARQHLATAREHLSSVEEFRLVGWEKGGRVAELLGRCEAVVEALGRADTVLASLQRTQHEVETELASLRRWEAAEPDVGFADRLRKRVRKARKDHRRAMEDADDAEDDEERGEMLEEARSARAKLQTAQSELSEAFQQWMRDSVHYPELKRGLAEMMGLETAALGEVWLEGRTKGDYDDRTPLEGGRNRVYKARLGGKDKVLKEFELSDDRQRRALGKEVEQMRRVSHPLVMEVTGVFVDSSEKLPLFYIEMPFCAGGAIDGWVAASGAGPDHVRSALQQVVLGVAAMHARGVIHNDLKPPNILMTRRGLRGSQPKITDFETCKAEAGGTEGWGGGGGGAGRASMMTTTVAGGTVEFMAPERRGGIGVARQRGTAKSDVYSLGKVIEATVAATAEHVRRRLGDLGLLDLAKRMSADEPGARPTAAEAAADGAFTDLPEPERECECEVMAECLVREAEGGGEAPPLRERDGLRCSEGHFVCGMDLSRHVEASVDIESLRLFNARGGRIICPVDGCGAGAYAHADVVRLVTGEAFEAFMRAREQLVEARCSQENEAETQRRIAAERRRWETMSERQRVVDQHRKHIVDDLLTLKCPGCGQAYFDFIHCCALTCSRVGCGAAFCAYCQEDCGDMQRAHTHVAAKTCNEHGLFPPPGALDATLRGRRQRLVSAYIEGEVEEEHREGVVRACAVDLRGVGVELAGMGRDGAEDERAVVGEGMEEDEDVRRLMEMGGWNEDEARWALEAAQWDVDAAAEMLMG